MKKVIEEELTKEIAEETPIKLNFDNSDKIGTAGEGALVPDIQNPSAQETANQVNGDMLNRSDFDGADESEEVGVAPPGGEIRIQDYADNKGLVKEDPDRLLKASKLDSADEVEEHGTALPNENAQLQDTDAKKTWKAEPQDLLKPIKFDWADEPDELEGAPLTKYIQVSSAPDVKSPGSETNHAMPAHDAQADVTTDDMDSSEVENSSSCDSEDVATPDTPLSEYSSIALTFDGIIDKAKGKEPSPLVSALNLACPDKPNSIETFAKIDKFIWLDLPMSSTQRTKEYPIIPWKIPYVSPNLRGLIPDYHVNDVITVFKQFDPHLQTDEGWALAQKCVEWDYMVLASQTLLEQGQGRRRRPLKPNPKSNKYLERLVDHKVRSTPAVVQSPLTNGQFHHYNFLQLPVVYPSATPPEVSLWAVFMFHKKACDGEPYPDPFSHKGVLISQASKLIDPYIYNGPEYILRLYRGSRLRDQLTGYVQKVYRGNGTWHNDQYVYEEEKPLAVYEVEHFNDIKDYVHGPHPPIFINVPEYLEISSINDNGRPQKLPPPYRWIKAVGWDRKGLPKTNLSMMESVSDRLADHEVTHPQGNLLTSNLPAAEDDGHSSPVFGGCDIPVGQIEEYSDDEGISLYGHVHHTNMEPASQATPTSGTDTTESTSQIPPTVDADATKFCVDSSSGKKVEAEEEHSLSQANPFHSIDTDSYDETEGIVYGGISDELSQPDEDLFTAALQQEISGTIRSAEAEFPYVVKGTVEVLDNLCAAEQSLFQHDGADGTRAKVRLGPAPIETSTINRGTNEDLAAYTKHLEGDNTEMMVGKDLKLAQEGCGMDVPKAQDSGCEDLTALSGEENNTTTDVEGNGILDVKEDISDQCHGEESLLANFVHAIETEQTSSAPIAVIQEHTLEAEAQDVEQQGLLVLIKFSKYLIDEDFAVEGATSNPNTPIENEDGPTTIRADEQPESPAIPQSPWADQNDLTSFQHKVDFNEYFFGTFAIGIGHQVFKAMSWIDKVIRY